MKPIESLEMPKQVAEGWGFATRDIKKDGEYSQLIYMTDGSANIYIADPNLKVKDTLSVKVIAMK